MRSIYDTPVADRFLMVSHRLSAHAWRSECDAVTNWLKSKPGTITDTERDEMLETIQRPLRETEHPFVIIHCYADIPENTTWNVAFDRRDTHRHEPTIAILRFGVILHRAVCRSLSDGWHQAAVIDFPGGIPELIKSLPIDPETEQTDYNCLCDAADFPKIRRHLTNVAEQGGEREPPMTQVFKS